MIHFWLNSLFLRTQSQYLLTNYSGLPNHVCGQALQALPSTREFVLFSNLLPLPPPPSCILLLWRVSRPPAESLQNLATTCECSIEAANTRESAAYSRENRLQNTQYLMCLFLETRPGIFPNALKIFTRVCVGAIPETCWRDLLETYCGNSQKHSAGTPKNTP